MSVTSPSSAVVRSHREAVVYRNPVSGVATKFSLGLAVSLVVHGVALVSLLSLEVQGELAAAHIVPMEAWLEPVIAPAPTVEAEPPKPERIDWAARGPQREAGTRTSAPRQALTHVPNEPVQPLPPREVLTAEAETGFAVPAASADPGSDSQSGKAAGAMGGSGPPGDVSGGGAAQRARLGSLARDYALRVHRAIADSARRDYPRAALRARIEGRVLLTVTVDRGGHVTAVHVARTSGHDLLDRAAVAAVEALHRVPPPPPDLPWAQEQTLPPLPVTYSLRI